MRIFAPILAMLLMPAIPGYAQKASGIYHKAQKEEKAGRIIEAYALYAEASAMEPRNPIYRAKTAALQVRAVQLQNSRLTQAVAGVPDQTAQPDQANADSDAEPAFSNISAAEIARARQILPPPELQLPGGRFDFHVNVDPKELFNQVAKRCGLQPVFDSDYTSSPPRIRFDIEDVDCREALRASESATSSFIVPISSKLILVSKDTPPKRAANEQTMSAVIPLPTALTAQELTEVSQAVKQVTGIEKLAWSAASNEILIRDRVSRVRVAKPLIEQLTAYRGSVVFDLRFLQLSDTEILTYGVNPTNTFNLIWGGSQAIANSGASISAVIRALGTGTHAFGISALQANVVAQLTQSSAHTILQAQIRSVNGLPASLHIGQKYPVLTAGYFGPPTPSTSGTVYTPPPSFTYQDLGVSLKVLPAIGNDELITLDVDTEYQLLAGQSIDGIPVLANRHFATRICLRNEEWAIIGGLMDDTRNKSISGVAGFARIPLLGSLFKISTRERDRDHIVIVMKPHFVGDVPASHETPPMRVGTETRPLSPI